MQDLLSNVLAMEGWVAAECCLDPAMQRRLDPFKHNERRTSKLLRQKVFVDFKTGRSYSASLPNVFGSLTGKLYQPRSSELPFRPSYTQQVMEPLGFRKKVLRKVLSFLYARPFFSRFPQRGFKNCWVPDKLASIFSWKPTIPTQLLNFLLKI